MIKVIGDIMLDRWILGTADRMSPEAPVPVLLENDQRYSIGGAGNLALNLGNLNVELSLHGSVGADKEGYKIIELLKDACPDWDFEKVPGAGHNAPLMHPEWINPKIRNFLNNSPNGRE